MPRLRCLIVRLTERNPDVPSERIVAELVAPPRFSDVRFDTYIPNPAQPSQAAAVAALRAFGSTIGVGKPKGWRRRSQPPELRSGVYLDGGFGVGKTHLLASLWHEAPQPKAFGTFVVFTNLVGLLGFNEAVERLSNFSLVCIDEFELDDPGDTVLMSTLLGKLVERGVKLAATSNTLPEKLGEGRFAADDFLREIQGLSAHFEVIRIDGEDYRHRGLPDAPTPLADDDVIEHAHSMDGATLDDFAELEHHLAKVHPSKYGALLDGVDVVHLTNVRRVNDQMRALRLVVLVDRLYDRDVPVVASGIPLDTLFSEEMLKGGYRKKYFRAISRLVALAREGSGLAENQ